MANGVPSLLTPAPAPPAPALMTSDAPGVQAQAAKPTWGIYLKGALAIAADSIVKVEYKNDWRISNAPQEAGAFQSYNKVASPFDSRISMTKGGHSSSERQAFLAAVDAAAKSLNLYDIVTPEATYSNANIIQYSYQRSAHNGVTLLTVQLAFSEVRQALAPLFTTTTGGGAPVAAIKSPAKPSGADPVSAGTVQPQKPTPAQTTQPATALEKLSDAFAGGATVVP
jgi:hypothetical protein